MEYILLNDITLGSMQQTIKVRTVRFCDYLNEETPPVTLRMDIVLLDEQGNTIEAQIMKAWVPTFKHQLQENSLYYIKYFQVVNARNSYRPVHHPYMIRFTAHTTLTEIRLIPAAFPLYACTLDTFAVLHQKARNPDYTYTSDVLGIFKGCSLLKNQTTAKGPKPLRNVFITDGKDTATVALWDQQAEDFDGEKYMEMAKKGPVVLLFVAVTARIFRDTLSLQGSTLCKVYVNPELPEAVALQNSAAGCLPPPTWHGPDSSQVAPIETTVADLAKFSNPHLIYAKKYTITAKIKSIVPNQSWWYLACTIPSCKRTTRQVGDTYKCTNPTCSGVAGGPRYRLALYVTDPGLKSDDVHAPTIQLTFFGPKAEELIGSPVEELINNDGGIGAFIPTRITSLYGKQFNLRISVSSMSLQSTNIMYQVDAVLGVPNITLQEPEPTASETRTLQESESSADKESLLMLSGVQETQTTPTAPPVNTPPPEQDQTVLRKRPAKQINQQLGQNVTIHTEPDGAPSAKRQLQFPSEQHESKDT